MNNLSDDSNDAAGALSPNGGAPSETSSAPFSTLTNLSNSVRAMSFPVAFDSSKAWVPQRKDVDNFYGSATEAAFVAIVEDRGKNPVEMLLAPDLRKRHRPRIEHAGRQLEVYFPKESHPVIGQTPVDLVDQSGQRLCNAVVKLPPEEMRALIGKGGEIVVDRDYRPAVIASLIKAAHLTLFHILGYRHVFSPTGIYLADILSQFYRNCCNKRRDDLEIALDSYFRPHTGMVAPMFLKDESILRGTITDNRIIACVGSSQGIFALGIIITAGNDRFCVFVPTDDGVTVDTYFNFLKNPPPSIAARMLQFCPADGETEAHWAMSTAVPLRIPIGQSFPVDRPG